MIHVEDDPCHCDPGGPDGPVAGTRVGHEMLSDRVVAIRVQHAEQSFRSARRELLMLDKIGDGPPIPSETEEMMDWAHRTAGVRPLVSP